MVKIGQERVRFGVVPSRLDNVITYVYYLLSKPDHSVCGTTERDSYFVVRKCTVVRCSRIASGAERLVVFCIYIVKVL